MSDAVARATALRLRLEGLGIRHRRHWVLRDLTWEHRPGTIAWVVGENGAGKSSLLRVLAGRARPAAGSVRVQRSPEDPTGCPLLYYHPSMRPPPYVRVRDWRRLATSLSAAVDLQLHEARFEPAVPPERRLGDLSTGEAKRLLLSVLLRRERPLMVLDEPYEHLSPEAQEALTAALTARAWSAVVVVATNQPVPDDARGPVLRLDGGSPILEAPACEATRAGGS